jgi:hypothetical protein
LNQLNGNDLNLDAIAFCGPVVDRTGGLARKIQSPIDTGKVIRIIHDGLKAWIGARKQNPVDRAYGQFCCVVGVVVLDAKEMGIRCSLILGNDLHVNVPENI